MEEGWPLTWVELTSIQASLHLFSTTTSEQCLSLQEIDQGFYNLPTPPLDIQVEAFP